MIGDPPSQDRSDEEREAARIARERARAEREAKRDGRAEKPATGGFRALRRPKRATPEPEPERAAPPRDERAAPPRATPEPAEQPSAEPPPAKRARRAPAASPPPATAAASAEAVDSHRAAARERIDAILHARRERGDSGAGSGGGSGRAGGGGGSGPRAPHPGHRRRRIVLLAVLALVTLFALWIVVSLFQPFKGNGAGEVSLTIPRGSGVGDIGELLEERDVVSSAFFFELRTRLAGKSGELKPGIYELRRDMSYGAAIDALADGPSPNLIDVTFPEGIATREISPRVAKAGVRGNYASAAKRSSLLNPRRYGASDARDLEGFLFPATYQLRRGATARSLVDKQVTAFKREWAKVNLTAARRANLTPYDVLIIASLVEREAQLDKERAVVASVIYNRLREGMNLGIDATVRYAANNWTRPVTRSQLASPSPYNTYNHPGLPPGPIGNPGLESMRAAAKPARTDYLYYVVKPGTCGEHAFAETADEHDRNAARYEAARAARGGRSPTNC